MAGASCSGNGSADVGGRRPSDPAILCSHPVPRWSTCCPATPSSAWLPGNPWNCNRTIPTFRVVVVLLLAWSYHLSPTVLPILPTTTPHSPSRPAWGETTLWCPRTPALVTPTNGDSL
eukprot:scaffold188232_cov31-Tisochrysis_lutea.AAC.1